MRAFCDVVHDYPHVNASVDGDSLVVHRDLHLGIAVDLDFKGLIAPVIRNADGKRLRLIAREIRDLAARAKSKQLGPDEIVGGTFTITNMGPFGTTLTLPIINQPQVAILATDGIRKEPVVVEGPDGDDTIAIHHVGMLALAWDHRAFDGAYAASFLNAMRDRPRDPRLGRRARVSVADAPLHVRWLGLGSVPRGRGAAARACTSAPTTTTCCCRSTRTSTRSARAPIPTHVLRDPGVGRRRARARRPRRRRHVPRPRPARRLPDRLARRVARRASATSSRTCAGSRPC